MTVITFINIGLVEISSALVNKSVLQVYNAYTVRTAIYIDVELSFTN